MAVASRLFYHEDVGAAFSAIVQLGPIAAIIYYFRNDLFRYAKGVIRTKTPMKWREYDLDARLGWFTLLGTIPLALAGILLEHKIDTIFRKPSIMAASLILLAIIMFVAERVSKRNKNLEQLTLSESMIIGAAQALALVPGASRSGVTITSGLFLGLNRESAARFSFLLSIPAISAAGLYKLLKVLYSARKDGQLDSLVHDVGPYLLGTVVAGVFAYVVVRWFMGYMKKHDTRVFIFYRILLGIALLILVFTHKISDEPPKTDPPAPTLDTSIR